MTELVGRFELSLPPGWQHQIPQSPLVTDVQKMQFVLDLAMWNIANKTGGPFAAAIFERTTNKLVAIGFNRVVPQTCSLAHAEAIAIALAQKALLSFDLSMVSSTGFELFASGQPCVQCFGMTWWSGLSRLVVGARATDIEELTEFREGPLPEHWPKLLGNRPPLPKVEVVQDICRDEACAVLNNYTKSGGVTYGPGQS